MKGEGEGFGMMPYNVTLIFPEIAGRDLLYLYVRIPRYYCIYRVFRWINYPQYPTIPFICSFERTEIDAFGIDAE